MSGITTSQYNVTNYLVPAAGTTHAIGFGGRFSAVPYAIDWRQWKIDNFPFQPQGVYIDNSKGTVDLTITILPIGYSITCPAGGRRAASFPAPNGQTATITGDPANDAVVTFVDYPVFDDNPNVTYTFQPTASGGLPLRVQEYAATGEALNGTLNAGATTLTLTPATANQILRKAIIDISGNATLGAAGAITVTLSVNGVDVFERDIYVPAAASNSFGATLADLDFSDV